MVSPLETQQFTMAELSEGSGNLKEKKIEYNEETDKKLESQNFFKGNWILKVPRSLYMKL